MKIKTAFTVVFSILTMFSTAQQTVVGKLSGNRVPELKITYDEGSNSLNSGLISMFYTGGTIDNNLKDYNLQRLKKNNIYGRNIDISLIYKKENGRIFGFDHTGWQAGVEWHNLMSVKFGEDLYKLIFYGNKIFAGTTADLSPTAFRYLNYYQLKAGLNRISVNGHSKYGFNIAFNLGNNQGAADFTNSGFYTSPAGDSLTLSGNMSYKYQSLNTVSFGKINGYGTAIDFFYTYDNPSVFKIEAQINNLGIIWWNDESFEFTQSEPIVWEGLEVDNLLQMPDPLMEKSGTDSLKEYIGNNSQQKSFTTYTPAGIKLKMSKMLLPGKIRGVMAADYRLFVFYRPRIVLQADFLINDKISLSPNLSYGGWHGFNAGFEFEYKFNEYSRLQIGTKYLSGMILQNYFSGFGGFLNFTFQI